MPPETVLTGPDGQPAIDQATQQPLSIEELLRRRGLLAYGGNSRMMPMQQGAAAPTDAASVLAARASSTAPTMGGAAPMSGGQAPTTVDPTGVAPPTATDPESGMLSSSAQGAGMSDINGLMQTLAVGAATGAGAALARRRKAHPTITSTDFGADRAPAPKPGQLPNGNKSSAAVSVMQDRGPMRNGNVRRLTHEIPIGEYTDAPSALMAPLSRALTRVRP